MNYPLANLALRAATDASSVATDLDATPAAAVNGAKRGAASFRSAVENKAWWQLDLGRVVSIGRIQLWSAERAPLRGVPFLPVAILASSDGVRWDTLAQLHRPFGGGTTQRPAVLEFAQGVTTRFIRVQGLGHGCLQFDELEAFRFVPPSRDSILSGLKLQPDAWLDSITLKPRHDAGFFSVMSVILAEILHYRRAGLDTRSIDDFGIFEKFKNSDGESALAYLVDQSRWAVGDAAAADRKIPTFGARGRYSPNSMAYKQVDFAALRYFVDRYFTPSPEITAKIVSWKKKYGLDVNNAFVVYYRGTDKVTEIAPATFQDYADAIKSVRLRTGHDFEIIVQTDQQQFFDFIAAQFHGQVTKIDEMPMTTGSTGMHYMNLEEEFGISRREFGLRMFAVVAWLSQARWLLTATGNVGFWLALLRGHARDLYQFHPHTQALIEPDPSPAP